MSIKDSLLKAKRNVRSRVGNVLGRGPEMEPSAVRQKNLNQIESRITESSPGLAFEMDFIKPHAPATRQAPETVLQIIKGVAEKTEYAMNKPRILIGRSSEVLDREGRMVRCNDVAFLESDEETSSSVGHTHARIWFDCEKEEFFILDEGSRYGTRILRSGTVLEVPSGEPEGIRLQSGDEVYLGQACLRFTVK